MFNIHKYVSIIHQNQATYFPRKKICETSEEVISCDSCAFLFVCFQPKGNQPAIQSGGLLSNWVQPTRPIVTQSRYNSGQHRNNPPLPYSRSQPRAPRESDAPASASQTSEEELLRLRERHREKNRRARQAVKELKEWEAKMAAAGFETPITRREYKK